MPQHAVGGSRPSGAYSPGIIAEGRFVYVSGQAPLPARTTVGVALGGFLVEIDCVAVLPSTQD
jgi:enamine deaminase RidA (YjgF/YER057c/UK114 family)